MEWGRKGFQESPWEAAAGAAEIKAGESDLIKHEELLHCFIHSTSVHGALVHGTRRVRAQGRGGKERAVPCVVGVLWGDEQQAHARTDNVVQDTRRTQGQVRQREWLGAV